MRKRSNLSVIISESRRRWDCGIVRFGEWTSEGGPKALAFFSALAGRLRRQAAVICTMYGLEKGFQFRYMRGLYPESGGTASYSPRAFLLGAFYIFQAVFIPIAFGK